MMSNKTALAALALVAAGALGGAEMTLAGFGAAAAQTAPAAEEAKEVVVKDMVLGQEDAPITLMEYASYTCPHCASFAETVMPELKKEFIDTGKVKLVYREVYFDRYGLWASMMARCGGDMRYFGIQDILYKTQKDWLGDQDPTNVVNNLKKIGRQAGMDDATMDACMQDAATASALMKHYEANMAEFDVQGTPTLVINGTVHKNMAYADLKEVLEAELK